MAMKDETQTRHAQESPAGKQVPCLQPQSMVP